MNPTDDVYRQAMNDTASALLAVARVLDEAATKIHASVDSLPDPAELSPAPVEDLNTMLAAAIAASNEEIRNALKLPPPYAPPTPVASAARTRLTEGTEAEPWRVWYFTFGHDHLNESENGVPNGLGCYTRIWGTRTTARAGMIAKFGTKWARQYSPDDFRRLVFAKQYAKTWIDFETRRPAIATNTPPIPTEEPSRPADASPPPFQPYRCDSPTGAPPPIRVQYLSDRIGDVWKRDANDSAAWVWRDLRWSFRKLARQCWPLIETYLTAPAEEPEERHPNG